VLKELSEFNLVKFVNFLSHKD